MDSVKRYLHNKPWELALSQWLEGLNKKAFFPGQEELVDLKNALGRITTQPVFARNCSPHYLAAAMDGYVVSVKDTFGASESNPVVLELDKQARPVDTGDPIPRGFDGVIMVEDIQPLADNQIEIIKPAYPWQHIRQIGEDVVTSQLVLPPFHPISAFDLGGLAAAGIWQVAVVRRLRVAVIPTGTELVPVGSDPNPGDIVEYNTLVLGGMLSQWGSEVIVKPIVKDDYELVKAAVREALEEADLVLVNAGSSAGREDFTPAVMAEVGEVLAHGVAIKPGKPTVLGIANNKPVVGIPGYPVSAALVCELFVKPVVFRWNRRPLPTGTNIKARLAKKVNSVLGSDEFVRLKLGNVNDRLIASPIARGAGVITSLMEADGMLVVPANREGYSQGVEVEIKLLVDLEAINRRVVVAGSHDISIDILDYWISKTNSFRLAATNVGSLGGLIALLQGEAECAGMHLLDPVTGEYNIPDVRKYLKGMPVKLVNLAYRRQGLIVPKGNPRQVKSLADLTGELNFVNRQKGSGTRVLLDFLLKEQGIAGPEIEGYEREEFTHLAVGAAVLNGTADAGLGILAAAKTFDLDFIPVAEERFDLCILVSAWEKESIQALRAILQHDRFKEEIIALGGYDMRDCGKILWEG